MKYLLLAMTVFATTFSCVEGCVTVNTDTETYTIDESGCVDH